MLQVHFELNMVTFHELDYSQKLHLRKNNLKENCSDTTCSPIAKAMTERHAYLLDSFLVLILPFTVSLAVASSSVTRTLLFTSVRFKKEKKKKKTHVCPRLPWQWSAIHFIQKSMKIRITGILDLFSIFFYIMYQIPVS